MSAELQLADIVTFAAPPVVSALSLGLAHWFPWHNGARILDRRTAYAIGTSVVVGVPVTTMLLAAALGLHYDQLWWAALLLVNTAVSGATVNLAYWIDSRRAVTREEAHDANSGR